MVNLSLSARFSGLVGVVWALGAGLSLGQPAPSPGISLPLNDLSAFVSPASNWRIVGGVRADLAKENTLVTTKGTGILANIPLAHPTADPKNPYKYDLFTTLQHGDIDLELDYMMASKSNSGVYLQGRYEIQLRDSWDVRTPNVHDNGGVYERWDEKRPEGQKGYEGHAARQNVSRAPGLWQHLKISFQAPRFNANGQKTENARVIRIELNGVVIQDDVELTGPTRGSAFDTESATGPIRIQGDHGAVAIRNIRYVMYDKPRPELVNLTYSVYKGKFQKEPEYDKTAPESEGATKVLSASVSRIPNEFLIRYRGTLRVSEPGEYRFNLGVPGGGGQMKINNQVVVAPGEWNASGKATLPKGDLPFELLYSKFVDWAQPALGLTVAGPGVREFVISEGAGSNGEEVDPILVEAPTNTILRSFMDMPGEKNTQGRTLRVTHAISVGSPEQVHYTYDLDKGALVQVWRGGFLDATPMWHDRGDGSSRPMGMVQRLGAPVLFLSQLASPQANWTTDTTGSGFRPKGYVLDESDRPTFRYQSYGATVEDKIRVLSDGHGVQREVSVTNPASDLYARIISGASISALENGLYLVDDQAYVRIDNAAGAKPTIRESNGRQELIVPVKGKVTYSILF
ncbi:family 16 glycoside hydrolase [Spirosoma panaciterrae]|uniref:family 16 glycoside hydrolase n=1 Tax=Spirosoma panaciterrae TaxID=496058 RepID=UPI00037C9E39|nr:family 16 glycoside hydrolase [Spirosoma panaciterrae]